MPGGKVLSWLRTRFMPHIWCSGCGHGIVMHALLRALIGLNKDKTRTVLASGIGCSSRLAGYVNACTLHTTHGRSLAFATGVKLHKPELTVIDIMGDGDCSAIGGNHFIHACRRNIDITAIVMNNNIYGMTGGQSSPTTPVGAWATTTPYGAVDQPFDLCKLAEGAGASYVARTTIANPRQVETFIMNGIQKKGFAVIEVVTHCHTQYGRKNDRRLPFDNYNCFKEASVPLTKARDMPPEELEGKLVCGEFVNKEVLEYTEQYDKVIEKAQAALKE
ncbi:MAG: 2-oxoacid:ferredoxin oxidoreductase subunit beta [Synergistaceae bacterium]|nr:2-oxoacid:ferredoxin oxidoreductase subunit beta [Synergistaceae bacterium]